MKKLYLILILNSLLFSNSVELIDDAIKIVKGKKIVTSVENSNKILKTAKLSRVTSSMLSSSKVDNIQNLLSLAEKEQRVSFTKQFQYTKVFKSLENGDKLLLKCLNNPTCNIENFSNLMTKSSLHRELALKYPSLNLAQLNHKVGLINENLMNKYFQSTGWTKIEGEVGRNGIDGLFIKEKNGVIVDVLIVESKYNKSGLQHTQHGKQMSKQWILKKIETLELKYPKDTNYADIKKYIENDNYRAVIWNLKTTEKELIISVQKVHDKNGVISTSAIKGNEKMKINFTENNRISLTEPKNPFQEKFVGWYREELKIDNPQ